MPKIFESPDKGKTVYQREMGAPHHERELIMENYKSVSTITLSDLDESGWSCDDLTVTIPDTELGDYNYTFDITTPEEKEAASKLPLGLHKKYGLKD